jgi:hypothetical protein
MAIKNLQHALSLLKGFHADTAAGLLFALRGFIQAVQNKTYA